MKTIIMDSANKYLVVALYEDEKSIGIIFAKDDKYYFVDNSLEVQNLIKTADEPDVLKPIK